VLVIDTSVVVAILLDEASSPVLERRIAAEPVGGRVMSVASYLEAGTVIAGRRASHPLAAIQDLDAILGEAGIRLVAVDEAQARVALEARIRFGKGFGAPAQLNFGDCFSYALARTLDAPLLFTGEDFKATDIIAAI
jgi:ribonuclease VapC